MEQTNDISQMLKLMTRPAFLVKDGIIEQVNDGATSRMVSVGTSVYDLMQTRSDAYERLNDGWLCLGLRIGGISCCASVTKMEGYDLFLLDDEDQSQLRSFALAGQELRLPLTNITSVVNQFTSLAEASGDSVLLEQSGKLNRSLFQMMRVINNMTDAYRYSQDFSGKLETRDVCALLEEQFSGCRELLSALGTELTFVCPRQAIYCLVDAEKLERAVNNLLLNAVKFSPPGSPIHAKLTHTDSMLYLTIQNEGTGSLDALKNDVFGRYLRAPGVEDSRLGIGLGMVLIRATAAALGGTVLLEQSKEFGTRVTMSMTIRRAGNSMVRSPALKVDYAGEWDHKLLELSEVLPTELYRFENKG